MKNNTRTQIVIERRIVIIAFMCVCGYFGRGPNNRGTRSLGRSWIVNNVGKKKVEVRFFNDDVYSFWEKDVGPPFPASPWRSTWLGHQYRYIFLYTLFFILVFLFCVFSLLIITLLCLPYRKRPLLFDPPNFCDII